MTVRLREDAEVVYKAASFNALAVRHVWPGGPLAGSGLVAGDVIVGFDGNRFTSHEDIDRLVRAATTRELGAVMVVRGQTCHEVDVSLNGIAQTVSRPDGGIHPIRWE